MRTQNTRRSFLQWGLLGLGAAAASSVSATPLCAPTAPQPEGPFYPGEDVISAENDLTRMPGAPRLASGQIIYLVGTVTDHECRPVPGVNVEIWQACASGKYNHPGDPNPAPLDPNFRYWGESLTDRLGEYSFKTIKPGAYPAAKAWDRPPHIHFRIAARGFEELVTQMYFAGEQLNDLDLILERIPEQLRRDVIVNFEPHPLESGALIGRFNISIKKLLLYVP